MHIRTNHPVSLYIPGKSKPESGLDRLVVLGWKGNTKTGREAHSARCFSIPVWTPNLQGADTGYLEILVDAIEELQRKTAHKYVTDMLDNNGGVCNDIPASLLEPQQMLADFLADDSGDGSRGKLSAEAIGSWYKSKLHDLVMFQIADNKGWMVADYQMSAEEQKKLEQSSNGYRVTLEKLAAPTPRVDISTAKALKKAIELLDGSNGRDIVAQKLDRKLEAIINPLKRRVMD